MPPLQRKTSASSKPKAADSVLPSIPTPAVFSFLKQTRGAITWSGNDLARISHLTPEEAEQILAILEIQGYTQKGRDTDEWSTTQSGEVVCGSKFPRFSRDSVEQALATLKDRIAAVNRNSHAEFKIREAVAYGDFLTGRPQVQAADVGIELVRRTKQPLQGATVRDEQELSFLKELRRRSPLLNLHPYEKWMSTRTHQKLL